MLRIEGIGKKFRTGDSSIVLIDSASRVHVYGRWRADLRIVFVCVGPTLTHVLVS